MLINFENVTFGYDGVPIVVDASFSLHEGERVGFVGANGEGKTTVLKLLTGELTPDAGAVFRKSGMTLGYLAQTGGLTSNATVYGAMREVFAEDEQLIAKLKETQDAVATATEEERRILYARIESLNKRIAARDSYHFDVKIKTVLGGMGFDGVLTQNVNTMSGGERTKLKLCRLLLESPELLVLDEPTNHLDIKTLFWLEEYLSSYRGALFVVSHDRYFLDKLTNRTVELEHGTVVSYKGNYSKYRVLREERLKEAWRAYEKQQEEIAKLQDYVDRNIVRATTAKSALSRVNKLERMEKLDRPNPPPRPPRFSFRFAENPYERVLEAKDFTLEVDGKVLLPHANFTLMRGAKCALVGDNGTGKSTLLKFLLSGDRRIALGRYVKIAYYDQENADLDPEDRCIDALWGRARGLTQTEVRNLLAQVGLGAEDAEKRVKELSGGMRAKLELKILEAQGGNVLILDEPTNHLDLPAREALEDALSAFEGTLLFVSHDRRFIERIATSVASIEDGALSVFQGGYGAYLAAKREKSPTHVQEKPQKMQKVEGYRTREERAQEAKMRARVREIETRLEAAESEEAALSEELVTFAADYKKVQELSARLEALHAEIEALYAEYEKLI